MTRMLFWYLVGVVAVLGLLGIVSIVMFVVLLIFQDQLTWDWIAPTIMNHIIQR